MAVQEVYGFTPPEASGYTEAVNVPVIREPSANLAFEKDPASIEPANERAVQTELDPAESYRAIKELSSKVYQLAPKVLDRVYQAVGFEPDKRLRHLDNRLNNLSVDQEDDTIYLHELQEELDLGISAPERIKAEIDIWKERTTHRQAILETLFNKRLDYLMSQKDGAGK